MTYCLGIRLNDGIVFAADSRTNAGVDNISMYRKLFTFEKPGDRNICVMTAGNLAVTQAVVSQLEEGLDDEDDDDTLYGLVHVRCYKNGGARAAQCTCA